MDTTRGIFDSFPNQPAASPFTAVDRVDSPLQIAEIDEEFGFEAHPPVLGKSPFGAAAPSPFHVELASAPPPAAPSSTPFGGWPQPSVTPAPVSANESDSSSIRQLELRAIFGVDRELSADEIFQRCRALPGIRHVSRMREQDMGTVESMKQLLGNLGFGGNLRLYAGSAPIEFIREGNVLLAVQTDGGFAPGVRETLMLVARELGRLA